MNMPMIEQYDRTLPPPVNTEVEQGVLGCILFQNTAYDEVAAILEPEHFYSEVHQRIYRAIAVIRTYGREVNPHILAAHFDQDEALKELGGHKYLVRMATSAVTVLYPRDYAFLLVDLYKRRCMIEVAQNLIEEARACDPERSAEQVAFRASTDLEIATTGRSHQGPISISEVVENTIAQAEEAERTTGASLFVPTGIPELDGAIGGLPRGEVTMLAARPSMGKTLVAGQIARNIAETGLTVDFKSLEMKAESIVRRLVCAEAQIRSDLGIYRRFSEEQRADWLKLYRAAAPSIQALPIRLMDSTQDFEAIIAHSAAACRAGLCDVLVIDYLGLVTPPDRYRGNRNNELGEITRGLKLRIANRFNIAVVLLHQLNRDVERRDDKRPMLADLRDSGEIEQDAGMVLFLYRQHYYDSRKEGLTADQLADLDAIKHDLTFIVAKNRHGEAPRQVNTFIDLETSLVGRRNPAPAAIEMEF